MGKTEIAVFGGGCFWCTEALFQRLNGVISVEPGYAGGTVKNPSYQEVCTGTTGHAEVIQITFNPDEISYEVLLDVFMNTHDPTSLNRQGNDVGPQYRSVIFYNNEEQKAAANAYIEKSAAERIKPIATEVQPLDVFYKAESYHVDYYNKNSEQPYCSVIIGPKIHSFLQKYGKIAKNNIQQP